MWKKLLILSLFIFVLFVFSAPFSSVNAGGKKSKINWQIVGTIVQQIDVTSLVSGLPESYSLIKLSAQGAPGPAKITLLSSTAGSSSSNTCEAEYEPIAYFDKNDFIAVFPDQSLLFAAIDSTAKGILCAGASGTYFKIDMIITGGKGRFEGAEGTFTAEGYGYFITPPPPFGNGTLTLVGENGNITGTIDFSD